MRENRTVKAVIESASGVVQVLLRRTAHREYGQFGPVTEIRRSIDFANAVAGAENDFRDCRGRLLNVQVGEQTPVQDNVSGRAGDSVHSDPVEGSGLGIERETAGRVSSGIIIAIAISSRPFRLK